jgi:hypothetical protein
MEQLVVRVASSGVLFTSIHSLSFPLLIAILPTPRFASIVPYNGHRQMCMCKNSLCLLIFFLMYLACTYRKYTRVVIYVMYFSNIYLNILSLQKRLSSNATLFRVALGFGHRVPHRHDRS